MVAFKALDNNFHTTESNIPLGVAICGEPSKVTSVVFQSEPPEPHKSDIDRRITFA